MKVDSKGGGVEAAGVEAAKVEGQLVSWHDTKEHGAY